MGKLIKAGAYFFAVIGFAITAGAAYVYVTNAELAGEFWSVRNEFNALPADRRQAVAAELPDRVRFERQIADDMASLPEKRQAVLYETLESDRRRALERMRKQVAAEAAVARQVKNVTATGEEMTESIKQSVSDVIPEFNRDDAAADPLSAVNDAEEAVSDGLKGYGVAMRRADPSGRVSAAVDLLEALDSLGDEVVAVRTIELSDRDRARLDGVVTGAKNALAAVRQTPGLDSDPDGRRLLKSVPGKLSAE